MGRAAPRRAAQRSSSPSSPDSKRKKTEPSSKASPTSSRGGRQTARRGRSGGAAKAVTTKKTVAVATRMTKPAVLAVEPNKPVGRESLPPVPGKSRRRISSGSSSGSSSSGKSSDSSVTAVSVTEVVPEVKRSPPSSPKKGKQAEKVEEVVTERDTSKEATPKKKRTTGEPKVSAQETKAESTREEEEQLQQGKELFRTMSSDEIMQLLDRIDDRCSVLDNYSVFRRERSLNWDDIAFSSYTAEQCQAIWKYFKKCSRNYRIMSEIVTEVKVRLGNDKNFQNKLVENLPGYPAKPTTTTGFNVFNRKEWEKEKQKRTDDFIPNFVECMQACRLRYDKFTPDVKERYDEEAKLVLADYKKEVKKFYAENPGLETRLKEMRGIKFKRKSLENIKNEHKESKPRPHVPWKNKSAGYEDAPQPPPSPTVNYVQQKLNKLDPPPMQEQIRDYKQVFFDKWKILSERLKFKWIDVCINDCVEYLANAERYQQEHPGYSIPKFKVTQVLSKDEIMLWESYMEKPSSPKLQAMDGYVEDFLNSSEFADSSEEQRKAIAVDKWNRLDPLAREKYKLQYKMDVLTYKEQIQDFFSKIPEFMKQICMKRVHKKFWKMLDTVDKVPTVKVEPEGEPLPEAEYVEENHEEPPRKKKKKKHKEDQELADDSDDEDTSDNQTNNYREAERRFQNIADSQANDMVNAGNAVIRNVRNDATALQKNISKNDVNEAIRGIFDARAMGRKYSQFYFYAKYVAHEKLWIDGVNTQGLVPTAIRIIETFLSLSDYQQQLFTTKWKTYHECRTHDPGFPKEPKAPPRLAQALYRVDWMKKKRRDKDFKPLPWLGLPETVRLYYMKRLYHQTRLFMKNYDEFVASLSPADLVEYALHQYRQWEIQMYTKQSVVAAFRQFVFPISSVESRETVGQNDDPEILGRLCPGSTSSKNPLDNAGSLRQVTRRIPTVRTTQRNRHISSDSDSDEDLIFSLMLDQRNVKRRKRRRAEMYNYPLDDILEKINPEVYHCSEEERLKHAKYPKATQTEGSKHTLSQGIPRDAETQTTILAIKREIRIGDSYELIRDFQKKQQSIAETIGSVVAKVLPKTQPKQLPLKPALKRPHKLTGTAKLKPQIQPQRHSSAAVTVSAAEMKLKKDLATGAAAKATTEQIGLAIEEAEVITVHDETTENIADDFNFAGDPLAPTALLHGEHDRDSDHELTSL